MTFSEYMGYRSLMHGNVFRVYFRISIQVGQEPRRINKISHYDNDCTSPTPCL
jgi:hypothetical protein